MFHGADADIGDNGGREVAQKRVGEQTLEQTMVFKSQHDSPPIMSKRALIEDDDDEYDSEVEDEDEVGVYFTYLTTHRYI